MLTPELADEGSSGGSRRVLVLLGILAVVAVVGVVLFLKSRSEDSIDTAANAANKALTSTTVKPAAAPATTPSAVPSTEVPAGVPSTAAPSASTAVAPNAGSPAAADTKFIADTRVQVPGITQTWTDPVVVAAGKEVCDHARSGVGGRSAIDTLINVNHVQLDDDEGTFARLSITTYCPDQQTTVNDAIAFDAFIKGSAGKK